MDLQRFDLHLETYLQRLSRRRRGGDRKVGNDRVAHPCEGRVAGAGGFGDFAALAGPQALDDGIGGAIEQVKSSEYRQGVGEA